MATKLKVNYEFVGDSTTPVTRTNSIKHGDNMLDSVVSGIVTSLGTKVDSETVSKLNGRKGEYSIEFLGRTIRTGEYLSAQGLTSKVSNNTLKIYCCYYNYDESNEKSIVQCMDKSGNIISTSNPYSMGHSNDMCYNSKDNNLYVCGYGDFKVWVINSETLNFVKTINIPNGIQSITYNAEDDVFYTFMSGVVREWNNDFTTTKIIGNYQINYGVETIEYHKGKLYVIENQPNLISILDVKNQCKLLDVSKIQDYASDFYPIGEAQAISVFNDDGDFIISGKPRQINIDTGNLEVGQGITVFGQGNVDINKGYIRRYYQASIIDFKGYATINANKPNFMPLGTLAVPFNTIGDFVLCLDSPYYNPIAVSLEGNYESEDLSINNHRVSINGNNATVKSISLVNCSGTLRFITSSKIHLTRCQMLMTNVNTSGGSADNSIEQSMIWYVKNGTSIIDNNKYESSNSTIVEIGKHDVSRSRLAVILNTTVSSETVEQTETLSEDISVFNKLTFIGMDSDNHFIGGEISATTGFFIGGGVVLKSNTSTGEAITYIRYIDNTHIAVKGNRINLRIIGEII